MPPIQFLEKNSKFKFRKIWSKLNHSVWKLGRFRTIGKIVYICGTIYLRKKWGYFNSKWQRGLIIIRPFQHRAMLKQLDPNRPPNYSLRVTRIPGRGGHASWRLTGAASAVSPATERRSNLRGRPDDSGLSIFRPGVNVMNFFSLLIMTRPDKLECLYLAITFQSNLTFAGSTKSLSKKEASERSSDWDLT
jgi:hypothetical protein